jgi:hypothetical protein
MYNCTLRGQCEEDELGPFSTLDECKVGCRAVERRDEVELIFQYNLSDAVGLAPSDRVRIIRSLTTVQVAPEHSRGILIALDEQRLEPLLRYPALIDYIQRAWAPGTFRDALRATGNLMGLELLEHYLTLNEDDIRELTRAAIRKDEVEVVEELLERGYSRILFDQDRYLLENGNRNVTTVFTEYRPEWMLSWVPVAIDEGWDWFLYLLVDLELLTQDEILDMRADRDRDRD